MGSLSAPTRREPRAQLVPRREAGEAVTHGEKGEKNRRPNPTKPQPIIIEDDGKVMAGEAAGRRNVWEPSVFHALGKETFFFTGQEISIRESLDSFGALIWPGALALCQYLENNREQFNMLDKAVLEIGAGTGLLSIVASLLGAWVTATDLPDILGNLNFNLSRNTRGRCRYTPQVAELTWGQRQELEHAYPRSVYRYDYVLAADVVYHHDCLDELLLTMVHFCQPGTTLLWANKERFPSDVHFTERFKSTFDTTLLAELAQDEVRIYKATVRGSTAEEERGILQ